MPDDSLETVFESAFHDSLRYAFVLTRSQTDGCVELQLHDRDGHHNPIYAGQFTWASLARLYEALATEQPGSILVPAYTKADMTAFHESGHVPPGFRQDIRDSKL
jgi:hypothetical protein